MARNSDRRESYMEEESAEMNGDEGRWGKKRKQQSPESGPSSKRVAPTPKRKAFKKEEEESIANFFSQHIKRRQFPTAVEAKEFLDLFPMNRSPKDIYDKCRNLAGRS